uniref:GRAS domain-containing protein n=1 Tax=Steinernema glaseri TaxID=37863 RepID=A0A1I7ZGG2_9BILA
MDAVPYDFIERTVLLASAGFHSSGMSSPFSLLRGHWGRFTSRLAAETVYYELILHLPTSHVPYLTYNVSHLGTRVEKLLQMKYTSLTYISIVGDDVIGKLSDLQSAEMVQDLFKRSIGVTNVFIDDDAKDLTPVVALLEAIPRVQSIRFPNPPEAPAMDVVSSLVEKHVRQGYLKALDISGHPIPRNYLPLVRMFIDESDFYCFGASFSLEDDDYATEVMRMMSASVKRRLHSCSEVHVRARRTLIDELKRELGEIAGESLQKVKFTELCFDDVGVCVRFWWTDV